MSGKEPTLQSELILLTPDTHQQSSKQGSAQLACHRPPAWHRGFARVGDGRQAELKVRGAREEQGGPPIRAPGS